MLSDDGGNPLAEVGLALSMAFFSLMIIMLVAILNSSPNKQQVKMDKEGGQPISEEMDFYVYSEGQLFDKNLKPQNIVALPKHRKVLLAVDPKLELSAVLDIISQVGHQNLQITKLDLAWQKRLQQNRVTP